MSDSLVFSFSSLIRLENGLKLSAEASPGISTGESRDERKIRLTDKLEENRLGGSHHTACLADRIECEGDFPGVTRRYTVG